MQAGRLRHRVTLQQGTETLGAAGDVSRTWTDVATVWGEVRPMSGREREIAGQLQSEETHTVRIRYRADVTPQMRLSWGGGTLHVVSVSADWTNARELVLRCAEKM